MVWTQLSIRKDGPVIGNLLPLVGVALVGWSAAFILLLHWIEVAIETVVRIVRVLFAAGSSEEQTYDVTVSGKPIDLTGPDDPVSGLSIYRSNVPVAITLAVISALTFVIYSPVVRQFVQFSGVPFRDQPALFVLGVVGVTAPHVGGFVDEYLLSDGYRSVTPDDEFVEHGKRLYVLHLGTDAAILGVFLASATWALVTLLLVKTAVELRLRAGRRG